jgi:hypothetical protein
MEYPISGIAERYKRLSFSVYKGNRIRDTLISKELLNSYSLSTFEGRVNYLDLTEMGEKALREMGYKIEKKREGGPEHEYWKHRIAKHLKKKGYEIEIESPIGEGKTVDIVAYKGEEKIAVEIETGKSDVFENILKNLNGGFSKIIIVPLSDKIERKYFTMVQELSVYNSHEIIFLKPRDIQRQNLKM